MQKNCLRRRGYQVINKLGTAAIRVRQIKTKIIYIFKEVHLKRTDPENFQRTLLIRKQLNFMDIKQHFWVSKPLIYGYIQKQYKFKLLRVSCKEFSYKNLFQFLKLLNQIKNLHQNGLIHGNLKCSNVFQINKRGKFYFTDFNIESCHKEKDIKSLGFILTQMMMSHFNKQNFQTRLQLLKQNFLEVYSLIVSMLDQKNMLSLTQISQEVLKIIDKHTKEVVYFSLIEQLQFENPMEFIQYCNGYYISGGEGCCAQVYKYPQKERYKNLSDCIQNTHRVKGRQDFLFTIDRSVKIMNSENYKSQTLLNTDLKFYKGSLCIFNQGILIANSQSKYIEYFKNGQLTEFKRVEDVCVLAQHEGKIYFSQTKDKSIKTIYKDKIQPFIQKAFGDPLKVNSLAIFQNYLYACQTDNNRILQIKLKQKQTEVKIIQIQESKQETLMPITLNFLQNGDMLLINISNLLRLRKLDIQLIQ